MDAEKKLVRNSAVALAVLISCASLQAQSFTETFGSSSARVSNSHVGSSFAFSASGGVNDGYYTVMRPQEITTSTGQSYWANLPTDHTGDAGGALMVLNAGDTLDDIYVRDFNMLPGHKYRVSGWRYVVNGANGAGSSTSISWSMQIRDPATGNPIPNPQTNQPLYDSGPLSSGGTRLQWVRSTYEFQVALDCGAIGRPIPARLAVSNQSAITGGNDFYVDDISVEDLTSSDSVAQACYKPVPVMGVGGLALLGLLGASAGAVALRRRRPVAK